MFKEFVLYCYQISKAGIPFLLVSERARLVGICTFLARKQWRLGAGLGCWLCMLLSYTPIARVTYLPR